MLKILINIFIFLYLGFTHVYAVERPVTFGDARVMGMGNTFTAVADDKNMLFFNPAGFATYGKIKTPIWEALKNPFLWKPRYTNIGDLTLASFTFGMSGLSPSYETDPLYELYNMDFIEKFKRGLTYDEAKQANTYIQQMNTANFHPIMNVELMSYARHYFGFGIFSATEGVIKLDPTRGLLNIPNIQTRLYSDLIFPIGVGIPVPGNREWSVGFTFKYFHRLKFELNNINDYVEFTQWATGKYINKHIDDYFDQHSIMDMMLNGIEYTTVPVKQFKVGTGTGFDLGVMYSPSYAWKYGLLLSDVYTKINWWDKSEPSRIPINARLGVAYMPDLNLAGIIDSPILALDVEDVFHQQKKNFFLKWHFGSEIKFLFHIFNLRFGINEGYPSYGAGFDFNFYFLSKIPVLKWLRPHSVYFPKFNPRDTQFIEKNPLCCCLTGLMAPLLYAHYKFDISYTGYELGIYPGQLPSYQFMLRFSLSYSY